jgi:hypothetical protein
MYFLDVFLAILELNGTGSGLCLMVGFGISGVEPAGSVTN